jgi:hypothetical protein
MITNGAEIETACRFSAHISLWVNRCSLPSSVIFPTLKFSAIPSLVPESDTTPYNSCAYYNTFY